MGDLHQYSHESALSAMTLNPGVGSFMRSYKLPWSKTKQRKTEHLPNELYARFDREMFWPFLFTLFKNWREVARVRRLRKLFPNQPVTIMTQPKFKINRLLLLWTLGHINEFPHAVHATNGNLFEFR